MDTKVVYKEGAPCRQVRAKGMIGPANPHLWQGPKGCAAGGRSRASSHWRASGVCNAPEKWEVAESRERPPPRWLEEKLIVGTLGWNRVRGDPQG